MHWLLGIGGSTGTGVVLGGGMGAVWRGRSATYRGRRAALGRCWLLSYLEGGESPEGAYFAFVGLVKVKNPSTTKIGQKSVKISAVRCGGGENLQGGRGNHIASPCAVVSFAPFGGLKGEGILNLGQC